VSQAFERGRPIFIHGILPRSGTNFLWDLLLLHPDCARPVEPVREDFFLDHSDHLVAFAAAVRAAWDPAWGDFGAEPVLRLQSALGNGLLSFLTVDRGRRLIVKNPSVRHLERFFDFFPTAYLLVLVRDGRSVTQSCMDTFGWSFERSARAWAGAADEIQRFTTAHAGRADQWQLVRYEDLLDDLENRLRSILQHVDLDAGCYDMEAARNLPVRGSSVFFGQGRSSVNWEPIQKDRTFAPKRRWRSWPAPWLDRFEWIAGEQLRAFGYDTSLSPRRRQTAAKHVLLDLAWAARQKARIARSHVAAPLRPLRRRLGWLR
jgi:protein-tyrosine sulfotransferase